MALPLVQVDRQRAVDPRRSISSLGGITTFGGLVDVVGRGFAIGLAVGVLLITHSGAGPLTVVGILAIGSALVSWSE
jgi:hypothetical protein